MKVRVISLMLTVCMLCGLFTTTTFATSSEIIELQYDDCIALDGTVSVNADEEIVEWDDEASKLHAKAVGETTINVDGVEKTVKVSKAKINVVLVSGQSNAAGEAGLLNGVAPICPEKGYGYYWQSNSLQDLYTVVKGKADDGTNSVGFYPAIADEWYKLTGEKTVVIHHAVNGSPIHRWATHPGSPAYDGAPAYDPAVGSQLTNRTKNIVNDIKACLDYLNSSGNFEVVHTGYYWLQGETDAFLVNTQTETPLYPSADAYEIAYMAIHNAFVGALGADSYGGILACRTRSGITDYKAIEYCGMRVAQQNLANIKDNIFMASSITEDWYEAGNVNFKSLAGTVVTGTREEIGANNIHYNQKGYNVLGMNAADNIYKALGLDNNGIGYSVTDFELVAHNGYTVYPDGAVINVKGNMRPVPASNSMNTCDANMAQIAVRTLPKYADCEGVTMTLTNSESQAVTGVMDSRGYIDTTKLVEPLELTVSIDGTNIKKSYTLNPSTNGGVVAENYDFTKLTTEDINDLVTSGKITIKNRDDSLWSITSDGLSVTPSGGYTVAKNQFAVDGSGDYIATTSFDMTLGDGKEAWADEAGFMIYINSYTYLRFVNQQNKQITAASEGGGAAAGQKVKALSSTPKKLELMLQKKGNTYYFYYSLNGGTYEKLWEKELNFSSPMLSIYSAKTGRNDNVTFKYFNIERNPLTTSYDFTKLTTQDVKDLVSSGEMTIKNRDDSLWACTSNGLSITPSGTLAADTFKNLFTVDGSGDYTATTSFNMTLNGSATYNDEAGFIIYVNDYIYLRFSNRQHVEISVETSKGSTKDKSYVSISGNKKVNLMLQKKGNTYSFYYSLNDGEYVKLCDDKVFEISNPMLSIFSGRHTSNENATFKYFNITRSPKYDINDLTYSGAIASASVTASELTAANIIFASYALDNSLIDVEYLENVTIQKGEKTYNSTAAFETTGATKIKFMIWDSNMNPLCKEETIPLN